MAFGTPRQIKAGIKPGLFIQLRFKASFDLLGWREHARFEHLRLEANEHGGRQKGFAAFGEILLIAAATALEDCRNLPGNGDALAQLIEEAVDDGDDVNIPGIKFSKFRRILKEADGQPCADIGISADSNLLQRDAFNW